MGQVFSKTMDLYEESVLYANLRAERYKEKLTKARVLYKGMVHKVRELTEDLNREATWRRRSNNGNVEEIQQW